MPPKNKFSKEEIIEAAFEIACEDGFTGITARSVAAKLKSSVAPIYVNFTTIDDLVRAVVARVFAITGELLAEQTGTSHFEKIGRASLEVARRYPVLYRELVLTPNPYLPDYEAVQQGMIEALANDERMSGLDLEERKRLFFKMQVFQTGLTALIANGHYPSWLSQEQAEELLLEVGNDLLTIERQKRKES
jgi:AcrR family transcriptional regulator